MARFRLASVLRARKVQEDSARGAVLRARTEADAASAEVTRRQQALATGASPQPGNPTAFIATLCARQGMAAEIAAAAALAAQAHQGADATLGEYTAASIRRAGVEKMAERHAAATRAAEEAALQRELDDLSTGRRRPEPGPGEPR
jgi:flagellar biosynthesis chaperone FliJ